MYGLVANNIKKKKIRERMRKITDDDEFKIEEFVPITYKDEVEKKLEGINLQIDLIGKVCDTKLAQSYEEYHNSIKSSKAQLWDDLTKLNFKLIEFKKQNTKEDFINKLKTDLKNITIQVHQKDRELTENTRNLNKLENRVFELKEEKTFLTKEIKNSKYYNEYLQTKLKELEEADDKEVYDQWILNATEDEQKEIDNSSPKNKKIIFTTSNQKSDSLRGSMQGSINYNSNSDDSKAMEEFDEDNDEESKAIKKEKLEHYFNKNIDIVDNKLGEIEGKLLIKYQRISELEKFNNNILQILNKKAVDCIENIRKKKKEKLANKDIFFNLNSTTIRSISLNTREKVGEKLNDIKNNILTKEETNSNFLHKRDKREIVKQFLEDESVKKFVYELLYKNK